MNLALKSKNPLNLLRQLLRFEMIYLLHGEDKTASYARIEQIIKTYLPQKRITLSKENTKDDLYMAVFSGSILDEENIIIVRNFIKDKKIVAKDYIFKNTPKEKVLIFWEEGQITPTQVKTLDAFAAVENFKPEPVIFRFLDSLSPNSKTTLSMLYNLQSETPQPIIIWHTASRLLLLLLAKMGANPKQAGAITGRNLADWQWEKIKNQARTFDLSSLKNFFQGCLKADLAAKTGKTDLDEATLTSFLVLKYLKA